MKLKIPNRINSTDPTNQPDRTLKVKEVQIRRNGDLLLFNEAGGYLAVIEMDGDDLTRLVDQLAKVEVPKSYVPTSIVRH